MAGGHHKLELAKKALGESEISDLIEKMCDVNRAGCGKHREQMRTGRNKFSVWGKCRGSPSKCEGCELSKRCTSRFLKDPGYQ
jgi:hypothetical protein